MADRLTYVYCVVGAARRPSMSRRPDGMPGAASPRLIELGPNRWIVVADVPASRYGEAAINKRLSDLEWVARAAVAHETVIESFVGNTSVLPTKLLTIFTSDDRVLQFFRSDGRRIGRLLERVADRDEWGVRVLLASQPAPRTPARRTAGRRASGIAFLVGKKALRDRSHELTSKARLTVTALYNRLGAVATAARRRAASELPVRNGPLLLDAAFLVPRSRTTRFESLVARESKKLQPKGYAVTLTGPWPAYSFTQD